MKPTIRKDPLFIVGYKRSGTTVFRLMLNAHDELFVPVESEYFQRVPRLYRKRKFTESDIDEIVETLPHDAFEKFTSRSEWRPFLKSALPGDVSDVIAAIYESCAGYFGKHESRWCDKKPQHWQFVSGLQKWYPDVQFIHLFRDPRDVIASIEENIPQQVHGRNIVAPHIISSWHWNLVVLKMNRAHKKVGSSRFMQIQYETLMREPEQILKSVCKFLEIDFDPIMLAFQSTAKDNLVQGSSQYGRLHKNTAKPISTQQIGRHAKILTKKQIAEIEFVARRGISLCGYSSTRKQPGIFTRCYLTTISSIFSIAWVAIRAQRRLRGSL